MTDLTAFLAQNKIKTENEKFVASKSFVGADGKPIEWEIKAIDTRENDSLKKLCTKRVRAKGNAYTLETDTDLYVAKLAAACTVFPDLKDAKLQDSYGVYEEDELLKAMLSLGEYTDYTNRVAEINGFDSTLDDAVKEAKN